MSACTCPIAHCRGGGGEMTIHYCKPTFYAPSPPVVFFIICSTSTTQFNQFCVVFPPACAIVGPSAANPYIQLYTLLGWTNSGRQNVIRSVAQMCRTKRILEGEREREREKSEGGGCLKDMVGKRSLPGRGIGCPQETGRGKRPPSVRCSKISELRWVLSDAYLANYWIVVFVSINLHASCGKDR